MTLRAGSRLGAYEIVTPIGAGGMGEVFRARDTRLNRDVDLWVQPTAGGEPVRVTTDPDDAYTPVISPDGRGVAYATSNSTVAVVETRGGAARASVNNARGSSRRGRPTGSMSSV